MWDDAKQMNAIAATLCVLVAAALLWTGIAWVVRQPVFALREVVVTNRLERASAAHLEAVVREELTGTFFTMDLARAQHALAQVPWVRSVALRRQWPHRLEVEVEEHAPFARWNDAALAILQADDRERPTVPWTKRSLGDLYRRVGRTEQALAAEYQAEQLARQYGQYGKGERPT